MYYKLYVNWKNDGICDNCCGHMMTSKQTYKFIFHAIFFKKQSYFQESNSKPLGYYIIAERMVNKLINFSVLCTISTFYIFDNFLRSQGSMAINGNTMPLISMVSLFHYIGNCCFFIYPIAFKFILNIWIYIYLKL